MFLKLIGNTMPQFMIANYGGRQPDSEEEGMAQMQKWKAWVQGLGDAIVNPGTPFPETRIVTRGLRRSWAAIPRNLFFTSAQSLENCRKTGGCGISGSLRGTNGRTLLAWRKEPHER